MKSIRNRGARGPAAALLAVLFLVAPACDRAAEPPWAFEVGGHKAFLMQPEKPAGPADARPWLWFAPTLKHLPSSAHLWIFSRLLTNGIAIAGVDVGEARGSPAGVEQFHAFHAEMVRRGFSRQPALLGQSRGGIMLLTWAMRHPESVGAFAGIYAVCNFEDWPLKRSLEPTMKDFGLDEAALRAQAKAFNPVENLAGLAARRVPMFFVHGDSDQVVPWTENGGLLVPRYRAAGGEAKVVLVPGLGHQVAPQFFESQVLVDFLLQQVPPRAPAASPAMPRKL